MNGLLRLRALCAFAAIVGAAVVALGAPAHAATSSAPGTSRASVTAAPDTIFIDTLRIDLAGVFLPDPALNGTFDPIGNAVLTWQSNGAPKLFGALGMQTAANFCGRIQLRYYAASVKPVATRNVNTFCPNGNGFEQRFVNYSGYTNNAVTSVVVAVMLQFNGGAWLEEASVTATK